MPISLSTLSDHARRYFLSPEVFAHYQVFASEFGFEKKEIPLLSAAVFQFALGSLSKEQLLERVKNPDLLPAVALKILSPIAKDVPGLSEKILSLGVSDAQTDKPISPVVFVQSFLATFPDSLEPHVQHRVENLLLDYVVGERSKDDLVAFLQRPLKLGGLEIEGEDARRMVEMFDEKRKVVTLSNTTKQAQAVLTNEELASVPEAPRNDKVEQVDAFLDDEIEEAAHIIEPEVSVDDMVTQICTDPSFSFTDPAMQKRCLEIVTARVREVRDAIQTRVMLEQSVDAGGLGVSGRHLSDMMERIERVVDRAASENRKKMDEEQERQREKRQEAIGKRQELVEKEEQIMAKRFVQATGKVPSERVAPAAPSLSRASAAVNAHMQLQQQEARIDTEKVRAAVQKTIKQEPVLTPTPRPKVQDVQFARRLAGPIEELQAISLTEFRRLSSDPSQAIDRLKDMIGLLEDQGYSKRVAGLQAFRASPLMRAYAAITQQALLSGTTVDVVLSGQKDKQGLKKNEFEALMKLNADLRF